MFDLHRRVNSKEIIVGWYIFSINKRYATGPGINPYAALVHEFFATEAGAFPIVHLTIDTSLTNGKLNIQAYYSYLHALMKGRQWEHQERLRIVCLYLFPAISLLERQNAWHVMLYTKYSGCNA